MTHFREAIKLDIHFLKELPPLGPNASSLIRLLADDEVGIEELSRVIEKDPQLAARILGLANAVYFGQPRPVCSVKRAIVQALGLKLVKSLVMGIVVHGAFDADRCPEFDLENYWLQVLATAVLARETASRIPEIKRPNPDCVYLGGLLHDLGKLLLAHLYPDDYAIALRAQREDPQHPAESIERAFVGVSRAEAGAWLASRWSLPPLIIDVLSVQGVSNPGETSIEVRLINRCRDWYIAARRHDEAIELDGAEDFDISTSGVVEITTEFNQSFHDLRGLARMLAI